MANIYDLTTDQRQWIEMSILPMLKPPIQEEVFLRFVSKAISTTDGQTGWKVRRWSYVMTEK